MLFKYITCNRVILKCNLYICIYVQFEKNVLSISSPLIIVDRIIKVLSISYEVQELTAVRPRECWFTLCIAFCNASIVTSIKTCTCEGM